ncbi:MAG: metallophosphoesterase [Firmicutes bacterium]|nr:metallophosphoesterase [Bacillota bacterium]
MAIYAIADLHLSFDETIDKPMDIYGGRWINHAEKIKEDWEQKVTPDDTVIIAGDISWALKLNEAIPDLDWIDALPGKKVLIKGNHELWWTGVGKLNKMYDSMYFLQNTCYEAEGYAICGSRGWICPGTDDFSADDTKIYERELLRLEMSLKQAEELGYKGKIIAAIHYPPTNENQQPSGFTKLFEKYEVEHVVYGHLHGKEIWKRGLKGVFNGVRYELVSQDYTDGQLIRIK